MGRRRWYHLPFRFGVHGNSATFTLHLRLDALGRSLEAYVVTYGKRRPLKTR